jgi:hypothetical protein
LFDPGDEAKKYVKESRKYHAEALSKTAQAEIELLNLGIEFDVTNPRVVSFLAKYGLDKAESVLTTLKDKLKGQLIEGINEGESIETIVGRLEEVYINAGYTDIEGSALERIARTEVIGASNEGALESYKQANIGLKKGWLAAMDELTRDTHIEADRRYSEKGIDLDEDFEVGQDRMPAPGQGSLASEVCNCRCSIIPVIED